MSHKNINHKKSLVTAIALVVLFGGGFNIAEAIEFNSSSEYSAGSTPEDLAKADFDGDGDIDVVVANGSGNVTVLLNDGSGGFVTHATLNGGMSTRSVVVEDFDGDGDVDFAAGDSTGWRIYVYKNDGDANFSNSGILKSQTTIGGSVVVTSPRKLVVGDLDNDGDLDLASTNLFRTASPATSERSMGIYLNNGSGGFTDMVNKVTLSPAPQIPFEMTDIVSGDFDGDNDLDLAISSEELNTVHILTNDGSAQYTIESIIIVGTRPFSITANDFDQDGTVDLAVANLLNSITVLLNDGNGIFVNSAIGVPTFPTAVTSVDIDADGDVDLIIAGADGSGLNRNNISTFLNDGQANFVFDTEILIGGVAPRFVGSVNLDQDIDLDVITANSSSADISVLLQGVANSAPELDSIGDQIVNEGELLEFVVTATDPDTEDVLTFSASNTPAGANLDTASGTFSWIPTFTDAGSYPNVQFIVTDDGTPILDDSEIITITVVDVNQAPALDSIGNKSVNEGEQLQFTVTATDPDEGDTLTYSASNTPVGATFINGVFTWIPGFDDARNYDSIEFIVTDDGTPIESDVESISITVENVNRVPEIVLIGSTSITITEGNTFTDPGASATDPEDGDITSSIVIGGDTVDVNTPGTYVITYNVTDSGGLIASEVSRTVIVEPAPTSGFEAVALLALNSIWVKQDSSILSGDVIVNSTTSGPYLNASVPLSIGVRVNAATGTELIADSMRLKVDSMVSNVSYNSKVGNGIVTGNETTSISLPIFSTLPDFKTATVGTTTIKTTSFATTTIVSGNYDRLIVRATSTVVFTGGTYDFSDVVFRKDSKIYFAAPSEIRIANKLNTNQNVIVEGTAGSSVDASDIFFYVAGINGTTGELNEDLPAVDIGINNNFSGNVYAPNGKIWIKKDSDVEGSFIAHDVEVGNRVQVSENSGF